MAASAKILLVMTNLPDAGHADRVATTLVERRLVACVNQLSPCRSTYRWQDAIEREAEVPLLMKTTADRYPALQAAIRELHPYQLPEIVAIDIADGLPAYLDWVAAETRPG